jgi:uncharacterized membrane protein YgdD (TMEM256/DUF423 family)
MTRTFLLIAAVLGFFGVALGAFGAHGLQARLEANGRTETFETATRYHLIHAVAMMGMAWVANILPNRIVAWAGGLMTAGTVIFSGSLYLLAIFNIGMMGAVAPIGGAALLGGWACLGVAAWRKQPR